MSRFKLVSTLLLLALVVCASGLLLAEEATEPESPSEPTATAVEESAEAEAVLVSDIAPGAEESIRRLRELRAELEPETSVVEITDKLQISNAELDELNLRTAQLIADPSSLRRIQDLQQQWLLRKAQLDNWEASLKKRSRLFEDRKIELREIRAHWEQVRASLSGEEIPEALVLRVDEVITTLEVVETELLARVEVTLTLQNLVSGQRIEINEAIARLDAVAERLRLNLLVPDSLPLWTELTSPAADDQLTAQVGEMFIKDRAALADFYRSYGDHLKAQLLLFVALLVLTVLLRRRAEVWAREDEALEFSAHALKRPISAALLLTLIPTYFFYPRAPIVVYELNTLLMMLPLLRLLPGLVSPAMRGPLYGLIALLIADQVHEIAAEGTLLQRVLMLLLSVAALAGMIWVLRPGGPASRARGGKWWKLATVVARVGFLTLGGSIVLNLIGNVSLARILADGTLASARFAVTLFAAVLVVDGLIAVGLRTRLARTLHAVRRHGDLLKQRGFALSHFVAVALWTYGTLVVFSIWEFVIVELNGVVEHVWKVGTIEISLSGVIGFFLAIYISFLLSRFIRFLLQEDVLPRLTLPRGVPNAVSSLTHYVILAVGFVLAMGAAGFELSKFTLVAGAFGVGIGFGMQTMVNNFISGLILMFERPIQVGDTIEIGQNLLGTVRQIGIRASTIRTFEGAEVIVPNGNLVASEVINWTLSDRLRRLTVPVGVAYGTDPKQVLKLLGETARKHSDVLDYPEPFALFLGFGESSLDFELRFWTSNFDNWRKVASQVTVTVHDAIVEAGIEIPFPQRDLHVRSVDPAAGSVVSETLVAGGTAPTDEPAD